MTYIPGGGNSNVKSVLGYQSLGMINANTGQVLLTLATLSAADVSIGKGARVNACGYMTIGGATSLNAQITLEMVDTITYQPFYLAKIDPSTFLSGGYTNPDAGGAGQYNWMVDAVAHFSTGPRFDGSGSVTVGDTFFKLRRGGCSVPYGNPWIVRLGFNVTSRTNNEALSPMLTSSIVEGF